MGGKHGGTGLHNNQSINRDMKQTEKSRGAGEQPIVVLTPEDGMVIVNKEWVTWKESGEDGDMPQLTVAKEVWLATTDTADRYTEVSEATAEEYQKDYDETVARGMEISYLEEGGK